MPHRQPSEASCVEEPALTPTQSTIYTTMTRSLLPLFLLVASITPLAVSAQTERLPSPEGAEIYLISPEDGAVVTGGTVTVRFGLKGMGVAPAGIDFPNTGHHHLFIDLDELPSFDEPLPSTDHVVHFGKGQTETTLALAPGTHTLQLILGDRNHLPFDPPLLSKKITITVR